MVVNVDKSSLCFNEVDDRTKEELTNLFHFQTSNFNEGFKYLGFLLKSNSINNRIGDDY